MIAYRNRYPRYADEIDSAFSWRICRRIHSFDKTKLEFRAWVFATLKYSLCQALKEMTRGRNKEFRNGTRAFEHLPTDIELVAPNYSVSEYLCNLSDRDKMIVTLFAEGHSYSSIGRHIGMSSNNCIKAHLNKALKKIQSSLEVVK